ncbi:glycoside hydrolase family 15 protein [Streptomyces sp. NPDC006458]|uniref:glycoside hydrolase family 15 protein n=1 Tax=Streptomyces sp. NPDC006458 TaxID=3154302 RepID=UPI0033ADB733
MSSLIEDYALLSDLETAAMLGSDGSVDWLCLPRFDSPACLAALVGSADNGFWRIAPRGGRGPCTRRAYRPDTLVLDTEWETATGSVRVTDFMPPRGQDPCLVRIIEGLTGTVTVRSELRLRFNQGRVLPWTRGDAGRCRVAVAGPDAVWLSTDGPGTRGPGTRNTDAVPFRAEGPGAMWQAAEGSGALWQAADGSVADRGEDGSTVTDLTIPAGRRVALTLAWTPSHHTTAPGALGVPADTALKETTDFWRHWAARCRYQGPWREAVVRSLITLKALTYAPTGGVVGAPTTSLPEHVGGERNWDDRVCRLSGSSFTLSCLLRSGYHEEAAAWLGWLVRTVAGDPAALQSVYGVAGQRLLSETEAPWLNGYEDSTPVRFGTAPPGGRGRLDAYGEVLDAFCQSLRAGIDLPRHAWSLVGAVMDDVAAHWREPDRGRWHGPARQSVHTKVMAWVAADRAVALGALLGAEVPDAWCVMRDEVRAQVLSEGNRPGPRSFVQSYGSDRLDASALLLPALGFLPAHDPRMRDTVHALGALEHGGFLRPHTPDPSLAPGDGREAPSIARTFWYADALAALGETGRAQDTFERVLAVRNDLGLLAARWDPDAHRQLGNAPLAVSHVALVRTAFALRDSPAR